MELEREFIERTDFSAARRGYDREEVDGHLLAVAEAVQELKEGRLSASGQASAIGDQVRAIVEAAEQTAGQIQATSQQEAEQATSQARDEAERVRAEAIQEAEHVTTEAREQAERTRSEAEASAQGARQRAESEAAAHVQQVQDAAGRMLQRAESTESELDRLISELRSTADSLVSSLRSGASSLSSELDEIRSGLADVRTAAPAAAGPADEAAEGTEPGPADAEPEIVAEVEETTAEAAYEAAPEDGSAPVQEGQPADEAAGEEVAVEEVPAEETVVEEPATEAPAAGSTEGSEGARLIALNMALSGTPREETARYLEENFDLEDRETILDEVYARADG